MLTGIRSICLSDTLILRLVKKSASSSRGLFSLKERSYRVGQIGSADDSDPAVVFRAGRDYRNGPAVFRQSHFTCFCSMTRVSFRKDHGLISEPYSLLHDSVSVRNGTETSGQTDFADSYDPPGRRFA